MNATVETLINLGLPLFLLVLAYFTGASVERKHYRSIRARERESQRLPAITFRTLPARWEVTEVGFVSGSVVISVDYFKRFLAGLRQFVGGRVKSYERRCCASRRPRPRRASRR